MEFENWLHEISNAEFTVFVKRLSANDTGLTGSHQVGSYIPKVTLGEAFPSFIPWVGTPKSYPIALIDSHNMPAKRITATFYESKNEGRLTGWVQGVGNSPMQDGENTGALTIFAFQLNGSQDCELVKVWICKDLEEELYFEREVGPVDPDNHISVRGDELSLSLKVTDSSSKLEIPDQWKSEFPNGKEIAEFIHNSFPLNKKCADVRILLYRQYEMDLFVEIERSYVMPLIKGGFNDVESFVAVANSVLNRRKSRSGKSLEYHLEKIFKQENLLDFGVQCVTEAKKKPDFLFPGCKAYHDDEYPADKLRMLAVKTTLKDRWRQVLNEASKISEVHLFTLQKGVSINQFNEMESEGVTLVVPKDLVASYPKEIRSKLVSLENFISDTKGLYSISSDHA